MTAIKFDTNLDLDEERIHIPPALRAELDRFAAGGSVRVRVQLIDERQADSQRPLTGRLQDARDKGYANFLDYLLAYPIYTPIDRFLTRDEANER